MAQAIEVAELKESVQKDDSAKNLNELQKKDQGKEDNFSYLKLFSFASKKDYPLIIIGTIASLIHGAGMPLFSLLVGDIADNFSSGDPDKVMDSAADLCLKLFLVGIGVFITSYLGHSCWMIAGERQAIEIRKRYFKSLLSQEIAFYDGINPNELATKIASECFQIQSGIAEKVSTFIYSIAIMAGGFIMGYIKGWQLALVLTGFLPVLSITGGLFFFSIQKATAINTKAYRIAGAISEEALNAIRTVISLGGQKRENDQYKLALNDNRKTVTKFGVYSGVAMGLMFFGMFGMYALGFFVGALFIDNGTWNHVSGAPYTGGDVLTVFFSIMTAGFTFGQVAPSLRSFAVAKTAGKSAFKIIERKSRIDIDDQRGAKPTTVTGDIKFRDLRFAYPTKQDRIILNGINFDIRPNEKTALVGESGCGKTTCMQLIERFYDIENGNGSITLDGNELRDLNLKWMRENIGYVGQEPVLFATSIKENLLMAKDDATDAELWEALKKANAYDFVQGLPEKLNTFVGNSGTQLSGGQKQRLAIARAILKDPKILLLDEATSALDRKNEMEIQKTLDEISEGRTTIVIAHRLSTIINSDHIIVFDQGKVVEEGRHVELIEKQGKYFALQKLQLQTEEKEQREAEREISKRADDENESPATINVDVSSNKILMNKDNKIPGKESHNKVNDSERKQESSIKKDTKSKKETEGEQKIFSRLFKYNGRDKPWIVFGLIIAFLNGCIFPSLSVVLSEMIDVFADKDRPDFRSRTNFLSLMFLILALLALLFNSIQLSVFNFVGENLSRKVRAEVFQKYINMPIGWFDLPENSPGALSSKLAKDAALVNSLTSSVLGVFTQAFAAFVSGMIYGFIASWQLTLISLALSPLMVLSAKLEAEFNQGFSADTDDAYKESSTFVAEAVNNMRTVASFGKEDKLLASYSNKLNQPLLAAVKKGNLSGVFFGISQFLIFGIYACVFYIGAKFIVSESIALSFKNMLQSVLGVLFAAMGAGNAMHFAPDLGSATNAAISVFKILDTKPAIDIDDPKQTVRTPIVGDIEFRNVWFKYPSREKQIFKNLSFKLSSSKKVALVGPSGCGKSTILALLQRFYDPDQGEILVDGVNIKDYDLRHLRNSYGVVSQEPVLFNGTIDSNIKYGKEGATDAEMIAVAEKANALSFIQNNEFDVAGNDNKNQGTGFQRKVGPKGGQLSGGQKQRIAIARAILKNPSVLILDEATSALDAQNEKLVQESLDKIMEGKTSVIVAHRISTIKDADEILVFNDGEIIERGNYQQLTQMQGMFYKLERGIATS